jgi:hypothetical protein
MDGCILRLLLQFCIDRELWLCISSKPGTGRVLCSGTCCNKSEWIEDHLQ